MQHEELRKGQICAQTAGASIKKERKILISKKIPEKIMFQYCHRVKSVDKVLIGMQPTFVGVMIQNLR